MIHHTPEQQTWKATSTSLFMDPNTPHWGWSWLERWLSVKPNEATIISDKESITNNSSHFKAPKITTSPKTQVIKSSYTRLHNAEKSSPSAPRSSTSSTPRRISPSIAVRKLRSPSPKESPKTSKVTDDAKSIVSEQSARNSAVESPLRDNESLTSSQTAPSYMAPTESAKAKSRLGDESKGSSCSRSVTPDRLSVSSAKKRASCSPARSRRSTTSVPDADSLTLTEHT